MPDALKLTDQDHALEVMITNSDEDPTPMVTFMDARNGQQITMTIDAFDVVVRAVYRTMDNLDGEVEEIDSTDDHSAGSKLN